MKICTYNAVTILRSRYFLVCILGFTLQVKSMRLEYELTIVKSCNRTFFFLTPLAVGIVILRLLNCFQTLFVTFKFSKLLCMILN